MKLLITERQLNNIVKIVIYESSTLRLGSKGPEVGALQKKLNLPPDKGTPIYGQKTKAAVEKFQRSNNLKDDGIAGPLTQEKLFGGKVVDKEISKGDFKGIEVSDSTNGDFIKKLDPKKLNTNSSVPIFKAGQPECAQFVNDFSDKVSFVGNAWNAHDNRALGSLVYSVFDQINDDSKNKVIDLWKKIDSKGGGSKSGTYAGQVSSLVSKLSSTSKPSNLKLGDIVGLYYPPSSYHEYAFYNSGKSYFIETSKNTSSRKESCSKTEKPQKCDQNVLDLQVQLNDTCSVMSDKLKEDGQTGLNTKQAMNFCKPTSKKIPGKTISRGVAWGMNTHIGIVGAIKNGVPLIFHNIHGQVYSDPPTKLHGGSKIVWVRRPGNVISRSFWNLYNYFF